MASDPTSPAPLPRRARLRRGLLYTFGGLLLLIALLLVAAAWLVGTERGAQTALSLAEDRLGGMIQAEGVRGRLAGPLHIGRLVIEQESRTITLTDLRVDWRPQALLDKELHLTSVQAARLAIVNKGEQEKEPAKLPERIGLPFHLKADQVRISAGEIARGPATLLKLGPVALALDYDGQRYHLRLHEFAAGSTLEDGSVATRFSGEARLSATAPYPIDAAITSRSDAAMEERRLGAAGRIKLGGSLAEMNTNIDMTLNGTPLRGDVLLRPFSEDVLGPAKLVAQALDLSGFDPALPITALDLDFSSDEHGAGTLSLRNSAAGQYGDRKLPLSSLQLRFRQESGRIHLDHILAVPGTARQPAGEVAGTGMFADGALDLSLQTKSLDLQRIDKRMRPTRLSGNLDLKHGNNRQEFTAKLSEPLDKGRRLALDAHGVLSGGALALDRARLQAGSGTIDARARVALDGRQEFSAQGKLSQFRLEELGTFKDAPSLLLNGDFTLQGFRQPKLEADLAFTIDDSTLAGHPLAGKGEVRLRGERLHVPRFLVASGANRLDVHGELAQEDSTLTFRLDAPQLAQLGKQFGGALQADGTVRGTLDKPRVSVQWSASKARLPGELQIDAMQGKADVRIDRGQAFILTSAEADVSSRGLRRGEDALGALSAHLRFAPQPQSPLELDLRIDGITSSRLVADELVLTARGTTARHKIEATLNEPGQSARSRQAWTLHAAGGLFDLERDLRWQGGIQRFDAAGRVTAKLASDAEMTLSARRIALEDFVLDIDGGRIAVQRFVRDDDGIATRGRIDRVQLAQLLRHMATPPPVKTDLVLGGDWDLRMADTVSGSLNLRRERGDVTMLGASPLTLGLRSLQASATADGGRIALQLQADGAQLGRIDVNAATTTGNGAARLSIPQDAAVSGRARIDVPSLRWVAPLVSPSLLADGRLQSDVSLAGTFAQPRFTGRITGEALRLTWTQFGLELRQGSLQSDFEGERLVIRELQFQGSEGAVTVSGPVDFGGGGVTAQLALAAERFAVLNRADRRLVVSGESRIDLKDKRANIQGGFTVDSGFFDIGTASKPELSDDVVIVGREEKPAAKTVAAIDISVALGDGVTVTGRGFDGVLVGQARLVSNAGEPLRAQGTLNVAKGTFSAYGRELAVEKGVLRFRGPLNNPALDILAMRRGQEVEAGVSVQGTVLQPRITLVSEPVVPDSEKLSWLVLGRGLASAGESDMGALQAAAAALLSKSAQAGVESRLASAFGLDALSVGTSQDTLQQRIVTLGKQISSRLYLSYQQGLETAASVVQLRYTLSPKLSLEAEAGTRSALSLFYNIAFD